jgi:hypothetical protein
MSLLLIMMLLIGLAAGSLALGLVGPWAGIELGFGLLGAGLGAVFALVSGVGALAGGLIVAALAIAAGLLAALGALLLVVLILPLLLLGGLLAGMAPALLPLAVVGGLVWLLVLATRPAPPPALPSATLPSPASQVVPHY